MIYVYVGGSRMHDGITSYLAEGKPYYHEEYNLNRWYYLQ